jgi:hypothetical protein
LTIADIQNVASYEAKSVSISLGTSQQPTGKLDMSGLGIGIGSDKGDASSTSSAGISGIAGNTAVRSTDGETGLQKIFDADKVQREIDAQMQITQYFGQQATKAVGDYATTKYNELKATDPEEAAKWAEGGAYRVALHALVGGLGGGISGAAGAAISQATLPAVAEQIAGLDIPDDLKKTLIAVAGTAIGAAVGGTAGAASGVTATVNNYLKHTDVEKLASQLRACGTDQTCRDKAFEEAYRVSAINDIALLNCTATANCDVLKSEFRRGYDAIGQLLDAGVKAADVSLILNLETNAQTIIRNALDQRQCTAQACKDNANYLAGIGKGLAKVTPAGLVTMTGVVAYELTTAILNVGLTDTVVTVAKGVAGLPAELLSRLDSSDPQVRGEALVDALTLGTVATAVTAKLGQLGYVATVKQVEAKVAKAAKAAEARTLADDMLAEADFAGRIPTRTDLQNHLINAQVSGKQISGGHNLVNFETTLQGAGGQIMSKVEIAPGVYEIEYKLANKNYTANGVETLPRKTVYDPAVYSDSKMSSMATEAAARGQIQFQATGVKDQFVKVGDIWFFAPVKVEEATGKVLGTRTVFPARPKG